MPVNNQKTLMDIITAFSDAITLVQDIMAGKPGDVKLAEAIKLATDSLAALGGIIPLPEQIAKLEGEMPNITRAIYTILKIFGLFPDTSVLVSATPPVEPLKVPLVEVLTPPPPKSNP